MLPKYCCSLLVGRRARRAGDDGVLERCSRLARRWRGRSGRACACGLAAVLLVMGGAERAQSTMGVSSLLDSAARRAVAFALRCCCKHVSAKAASPLAPRCAPMCLSLVLAGSPRARSQITLASKPRVPDDPSQRSTAGPARTGSVASSHLSLYFWLLCCGVSAFTSAVQQQQSYSCTARPVPAQTCSVAVITPRHSRS